MLGGHFLGIRGSVMTSAPKFQLPMIRKWERTRASQTEGKWELQAKVGLGCRVVILWENCDHVHATAGSEGHQEAAHTKEPDQGGAQAMKRDGKDLASVRHSLQQKGEGEDGCRSSCTQKWLGWDR